MDTQKNNPEFEKLMIQIKELKSQKVHSPEKEKELMHKILELSVNQAKSATESYQELLERHRNLSEKYDHICLQEQQLPDRLYMEFSLDPAKTMEMLLEKMEWQRKKSDQTGKAWKWSYRLTFRHRFKTAWRLIFRPRHLKMEKS